MNRSGRRALPSLVMGSLVLGICLVLGVGGAAPLHGEPVATGAAEAGFVTSAGGELWRDGRVWRPIGFNQYRLTSMPGGFVCDPGYGAISDASLAARLDQMKAAGANVVRTWFFQRYWQQGPAPNPWAPFDRLIAAARARDLLVIPTLVNHWKDCEWGDSIEKNHGFYAWAYRSAGFGYALSYRDWAVMVAGRYANDPAIAFWQLVNEAEADFAGPGGDDVCPDDADRVLRRFADDMTAEVKAVDPNHLVSLGTIGSGQCGAVEEEYGEVHAGAVDLCEIHQQPNREGVVSTVPVPGDDFNGVAVRLRQCALLGKPIVVGEVGIPADVGPSGLRIGSISPATLQRRADLLSEKIAAQSRLGMDGFVVWESVPEPSTSPANLAGDGLWVGPGDPVEPVLRAWQGSNTLTVGGFAWSTDGQTAKSGPPGTTVTIYATGLRPNTPYRLVTGDAGATEQACRFNAVPVNGSIRTSNGSGFVGLTGGPVSRAPGHWHVCFRSLDGRLASSPVLFQVT